MLTRRTRTISPGPTRACINSQQSVPDVAATLAPAAAPVPAAPATVDTSGLERLISSRLDMVEDVLRMVEHRLDEGVPVGTAEVADGEDASGEDGDEAEYDSTTGDRIITASGEVVEVGGSARMMEDDQGQLVELYEAQALAANPFLVAPAPVALETERQVRVLRRLLRFFSITCPVWPP